MADEADEWEAVSKHEPLFHNLPEMEAMLPPLPDPSLPPGSWYADSLGEMWLNCNDVWVPKVGDMLTSIHSGQIRA